MTNVSQTKTEDYYQERYRPHIHFTPEKMWMNDPNGLVYYEEEYHLFYQYHPDGKEWGPMHWGHAVSDDLFHWRHLPIALFPDEHGTIFSGSVVVDWKDSSGFFDGGHGLVALFTHHKEGLQQQSVAYSGDNGRTWLKYEENPVIKNPGRADFRDPKVFWHKESSRWVMVLATGRSVMLYQSVNLRDWSFLQEVGDGWDVTEGIWECPDLFPLQHKQSGETKWILQIDVNDGAYAGGSGGIYFIGEFDGKSYTLDHNPQDFKWMDYGKDFYAAQSFSDHPQEGKERIMIAWMSNWQYANVVPTDPWRSAMSLPRQLELHRIEGEEVLVQTPVCQLDEICSKKTTEKARLVAAGESWRVTTAELPLRWQVILDLTENKRTRLEFFKSEGHSPFQFVIDTEHEVVFVSRKANEQEPFSNHYPVEVKLPESIKLNGILDLDIIVDRSSVEVYMDSGKFTITNLVLPETDVHEAIVLKQEKGTVYGVESVVSALTQTLKRV
ncbi:glycoside hydrolase family 32 protein [Salsuginibacillus kocurii]|uniref:glycoside hydrolase family 32 protein n=1 Tax=Salsuginibacillus kocurii TaxID=427078 RepID=UPI00037CE8B4|nr:glycoside hydrolase family 32 protein [Salsuginibacillus kocurii]